MMNSCIAMAVFGLWPHQVSSPFVEFIGFKGIVFSGFDAVVENNRFCIGVRSRLISPSSRGDHVLRGIQIDKAPQS
jgi:hypothetical protein